MFNLKTVKVKLRNGPDQPYKCMPQQLLFQEPCHDHEVELKVELKNSVMLGRLLEIWPGFLNLPHIAVLLYMDDKESFHYMQ